jgi:quercetin dioxygenase-like cupin family protein
MAYNSWIAVGLASVGAIGAEAGCAHGAVERSGSVERPMESPSAALVLRRADVMKREPDTRSERARVWTMKRTAQSRTNLVEMSGKLSYHVHPDAEHTLLVVQGSVCAWTGTKATVLEEGDYISIPVGVPHKYETITKKALLLSFDAPAYDPAKTVTLSEEGVVFESCPTATGPRPE